MLHTSDTQLVVLAVHSYMNKGTPDVPNTPPYVTIPYEKLGPAFMQINGVP